MSATFRSEKEARKWGDTQDRKLEQIRRFGSADTPKGSTFPDFIQKYTEEFGSVKTFGKNKAACLSRLSREFKGVLMSDMTKSRINQFVDKRSRDRNRDGNIISGVTISIDLSYISTILKWASEVKLYDVEVEAAKQVRGGLKTRGFDTRSKERVREATKEELEKIFSEYSRKAGRQIIPMTDIILFAIHSAMRQEEICSIKIEDIDREDKTVIIRNRKHPEKKEGNDQTVPLLGEGWNLAMRYAGDREEGRVFSFNHRSVSSSFTRVCKKCKIKDLHFHDLRHTAIGILFELGLQIQEVAVVSGHSDWKMLKRYTHIDPANVHATFENRKARRRKREAVMDFLDGNASD